MANAIALAALAKAGKAYSTAEQAKSATAWIGVTTTALADGSTTNPITINGQSITAAAGNIAQYGGTEYIWSGSAWQEFGGNNDFVVTFTKSGSTWSADKNNAVISDAVSAGKRVIGKVAANLVTDKSAFQGQTFLLPLMASNSLYGAGSGYPFCGVFQTDTITLFVNIVIGLTSYLAQVVTAYIKEITLPELPSVTALDEYKVLTVGNAGLWHENDACHTVTYTVTGQPVDGVYPLYTDIALSDIQFALGKHANIRATLTVGTDTAILSPASIGTYYVRFSNVVMWNGVWSIFSIEHFVDQNDTETCQGYIIPINTTVMSYNTTSGKLAITNVPEVTA